MEYVVDASPVSMISIVDVDVENLSLASRDLRTLKIFPVKRKTLVLEQDDLSFIKYLNISDYFSHSVNTATHHQSLIFLF